MRTHHRSSRVCSRAGCNLPAVKTLTYIYAQSTAVLGPLAMYAEPHSYDLCQSHSAKLTLPNGWTVNKLEQESDQVGPSEDDLMAIANAVREVAQQQATQNTEMGQAGQAGQVNPGAQPEIGRRGHLRALPSQ